MNILENKIRTIIKTILNESDSESESSKISQIVRSISGKGVEDKRIAALEQAGYDVSFYGIKWNFGQVGRTIPFEDGYLSQLTYAIGVRNRKNGYHANKCDVYFIKSKENKK